MQPYQNFQPVMSAQYMNPYGQSPIQPPYMDRLSQLQSMQQSLQPQQFAGLNGRVVESIDSIMASDVPMDGTFAVFPKRDMSEVCLKYWTGEGKIATVIFKPITQSGADSLSSEQTNVGFDDFLRVLEGLGSKVDTLQFKLDEVLRHRNSNKPPKREVTSNE